MALAGPGMSVARTGSAANSDPPHHSGRGVLQPVDWSQMVVAGPEQHRDHLGRLWHGYWASITVAEEDRADQLME